MMNVAKLDHIRQRLIALYRQRAVTMLVMLALASAISIVLVAARVVVYDSRAFLFMIWNLFLAWIPFLISFFLYQMRVRSRWALVIAGCAWLAFFPNAPYMVTDLIHLGKPRIAPIWFDSMMLAMFAWNGLFLALVSLRMMQSLVRQRWGNLVSWLFAFAVLVLSGFGVYLGRFERWNSWDVVTNPSPILADIFRMVSHPLAHPKAVAMTLLMATFMTIAYLMTSMLLSRPLERGEHDF